MHMDTKNNYVVVSTVELQWRGWLAGLLNLAHRLARRPLARLLARHRGGRAGGTEVALRPGGMPPPPVTAVGSRHQPPPPCLLEPQQNYHNQCHYFVSTFPRIVPMIFRNLAIFIRIPTALPGPPVTSARALPQISRP